MKNGKTNPIAAAIAAALVAAVPAFGAQDANDNPFAADELRDGYHLFASKHGEEGKCGEGKCGEGDGDGDGEGDGGSGDAGDGDDAADDGDAGDEEA